MNMTQPITLRFSVRHIEPSIWRDLRVPADLPLEKLHIVIQILFDWTDSHLWQFEVGKNVYGLPNPDDDFAPPGGSFAAAKGKRLNDVLAGKKKFLYLYDFGDDWCIDIAVRANAKSPEGSGLLCLGGARAGPPDDIGGVHGYMHICDVLADPGHEEHDGMLEWIDEGWDAEHFDLAEMNRRLKRAFPKLQ